MLIILDLKILSGLGFWGAKSLTIEFSCFQFRRKFDEFWLLEIAINLDFTIFAVVKLLLQISSANICPGKSQAWTWWWNLIQQSKEKPIIKIFIIFPEKRILFKFKSINFKGGFKTLVNLHLHPELQLWKMISFSKKMFSSQLLAIFYNIQRLENLRLLSSMTSFLILLQVNFYLLLLSKPLWKHRQLF